MTIGLEAIFWLLFFGLILMLWAIVEVIERRKHPQSPWLKTFGERDDGS